MSPRPPGVMHASYAHGRRTRPSLSFRYRVRASVAVQAYRARIAAASVARPPRVLDLGAAEGLTLLEVRHQLGGHGRFDGVELSEPLLANAPRLPANVRLLRGDIHQLPPSLADDYDLITILAVLEHVDDPARVLRQAFSRLRPGGVLVVTCPHPRWDDIAAKLGMVGDEHHEQQLDARRLVGLVRAAGFVEAEFQPFMFAPVATLPYLGLPVSPGWALRIDARLRKLPGLGFSFVNQAVVAVRPSSP